MIEFSLNTREHKEVLSEYLVQSRLIKTVFHYPHYRSSRSCMRSMRPIPLSLFDVVGEFDEIGNDAI